jgi:hypothetical protein
MKKIKNILTGWFLVLIFWDSPKAKKRREVCKTCTHLKGWFWFVYCNDCGCPIIAKSRIDEEECPLNKW